MEKKLGINGSSEPLAGKKHRLDDSEYLEESRELVDNVKNAVSASMCHTQPHPIVDAHGYPGFLKKKKKAKTSSPPAAESTTTKVTSVVSAVADKVLDAPEAAPIALVASAATGMASA